MADGFYDPTNGSDTTGVGTEGNPYASFQFLVDNFTWATSGGNSINGADTSADVLSATIVWSAGLLANDGSDNPMIIQVYDAGGSLVITYPNGETERCFELDGDDAAAELLDGALINVHISGLKGYDVTGFLIDPHTTWTIRSCEFFGAGSTVAAIDGGAYCVDKVYVHSDGLVSGQDGIEQGRGVLINSFVEGFDGYGVRLNASEASVINSVVDDCDEGGIIMTADRHIVGNNTVNGNSTANANGIFASGSGADDNTISHNIVANYSGTDAVAIKTTSGGTVATVEGNRYYNNTTNEEFNETPVRELDNLNEPSDPFTDSAADDFSVKTGSLSYQVVNRPFGLKLNVGADQKDNAGGGGGGGTVQLINGGLIS